MQVTVTMFRRKSGRKVAAETFTGDTVVEIMATGEPMNVLNWMRIEVAPYWKQDQMWLDWRTDDRDLNAAMYGFVLAWGFLGETTL